MMVLIKNIYDFAISCWYHFLVNPIKMKMMMSCGNDVHLDRGCKMDWFNVTLGNDIHIGRNALFLCTNAPVIIGDHVMFGPNVTIITGDHEIDIVGRYMTSISESEKSSNMDKPIIFEGDNWVGANVTILKGVTLKKGAIVAAGAVVTTDVPSYAIVGGVPSKIISHRFSEIEILEHEKILGNR